MQKMTEKTIKTYGVKTSCGFNYNDAEEFLKQVVADEIDKELDLEFIKEIRKNI